MGQNSAGSLSVNSGINNTVNFIHSSGYGQHKVEKSKAAAPLSKKNK